MLPIMHVFFLTVGILCTSSNSDWEEIESTIIFLKARINRSQIYVELEVHNGEINEPVEPFRFYCWFFLGYYDYKPKEYR